MHTKPSLCRVAQRSNEPGGPSDRNRLAAAEPANRFNGVVTDIHHLREVRVPPLLGSVLWCRPGLCQCRFRIKPVLGLNRPVFSASAVPSMKLKTLTANPCMRCIAGAWPAAHARGRLRLRRAPRDGAGPDTSERERANAGLRAGQQPALHQRGRRGGECEATPCSHLSLSLPLSPVAELPLSLSQVRLRGLAVCWAAPGHSPGVYNGAYIPFMVSAFARQLHSP